MKTFEDLTFTKHPEKSGNVATMTFPNGRKIVVLIGADFHSDGMRTYEVHRWNAHDTADCLRNVDRAGVTGIMAELQKARPRKK